MPYPHQPYYQDRRSVSDLCYDFPADEPLVEGLHAMQVHFVRNGVNVDIPVLRVMNTAHFLASYMFATTCSGDQLEYDVLAYMSVGRDKQMMLMTMIVLAAMLKRTDGVRASQCRNVLLEDRSEDFYEGVSLYERFITSAQKRFEEQDFMTDVMAEITDLRELAEQLINEKTQLQKQIQTMSKIPKHQTTVYNYGTYNDIHDNPHATIYATAPQDNQPDSILPPENDYTALVRWLEFEKLRGNDYYAEADCNRTKLCRNLLKIIGWEPDQNSLRKAQSR
ncbi:MAG: hypothetical protein J5823_04220 [Paludibacteraceae bacterium]|nr:hypothetical protein [Paludibacteraceae bacterium]